MNENIVPSSTLLSTLLSSSSVPVIPSSSASSSVAPVSSPSSPSKLKQPSEELKDLLQHQKDIHEWIVGVKYRIHELETSYLDEPNSLGNIIKGWDPDGRLGPIKRQNTEDKDRLFSNSSYQVWMEMKSHHESEIEKKQSSATIKTEQFVSLNSNSQKGPRQKKIRRSSASSTTSSIVDATEPWADQFADY